MDGRACIAYAANMIVGSERRVWNMRPKLSSLVVTLISAVILGSSPSTRAAVVQATVYADDFFNPTGILAAPGQSFAISSTGEVDISVLNGGYKTDADGTILITPPPDSGAFEFFRDRAAPAGSPPLIGSAKIFSPLAFFLPGHLEGVPYGALVAGFSPNPFPSSFADFGNGVDSRGFVLVGSTATITAPSTGGYLFLGVNDFNNPGGDNAGAFESRISTIPEPTTVVLFGVGVAALLARQLQRRSH
jgi:hypothetical protein